MAETDPDRLDDVDREIRINELRERARELAGGEMTSFEAEDLPPEVAEQFWEGVVNYEEADLTCGREQLEQDGVELPAPESLSGAALAAKLEEIFVHLAEHNTYFCNTDHLSDAALYRLLLDELLLEEYPEPAEIPRQGGYFVDLVGSGSEEDIQAWLRYYASEEDRARWLADFPDIAMPPRETPPYDRDRHLPEPEGF